MWTDIDDYPSLVELIDGEVDTLHGREELTRLFWQVRNQVMPALAAPKSGILSTLLAAFAGRAIVMVSTVFDRPHAFVRIEYGGGEFVDIDAAGDEIGAEQVRVESAGRLFPDALPLQLCSIDPSILVAAAEAARARGYHRTALALARSAERDRLVS